MDTILSTIPKKDQVFLDGGLRRQLMNLAMGLTSIGIVLLFVSLITVIWLQSTAGHLVTVSAPAVVSVQKVQLSLQSSLASLRGWVLSKDTTFMDSRRRVWEEEIEPITRQLLNQTEAWVGDDERLIQDIVLQLTELKESQWWVEDTVILDGNEPAKLQLRMQIEPMSEDILRSATALQRSIIDSKQSSLDNKAHRVTSLLVSLSAAQKNLQTFTVTAEVWAKKQFVSHQDKVTNLLAQMSSEVAGLSLLEREYLEYIQREWTWYQLFSKDLIEARESSDWNVALQLMASDTMPLARSIEQALEHLSNRQLALMEQDGDFLQTAGTVAVIISMLLIALLALLAYSLAERRATKITKPILMLAAATRELVRGVLKHDLPVTSLDEIGALTAAFNQMRTDLQRTEAALKASHKRVEEELEQASAYIQSVLPEKWLADGLSIRTDWQYLASSELGGDLFGYEYLPDGKFMIYLLDVTGHGIGSSLLSVTAHDTLRRQTLPNTCFDEPAQVLRSLNKAFPISKNHGKMFTIWYAVYDPIEKILTYASGGHHPALLFEKAEDGTISMLELSETNLMIGVLDDYAFEQSSYHIRPGTKLYLFSDCAYEVRDSMGEMLDIDGLKKIIETVNHEPNVNRMERIMDAVADFDRENTFFDDYSMVEVEFN